MNFFKKDGWEGLESNLFSTHIFPWIIFLTVIFFMFIFKNKLRNSKNEYKIRIGVTIAFVILEIGYWFWKFQSTDESLVAEITYLFLQGCALSFWFAVITNLTNKTKLLKAILFLGMVGPLMTLTIGPYETHSFDSFRYWHFYLSHIFTFSTVLYYLIVKQVKLTWKDFIFSFTFMFIYALLAIALNVYFETTNILYLYNAAQTPFKDWEWYQSIPTLAIIYFIPFYLFYYFKNEKVNGKRIHLHRHIIDSRK